MKRDNVPNLVLAMSETVIITIPSGEMLTVTYVGSGPTGVPRMAFQGARDTFQITRESRVRK